MTPDARMWTAIVSGMPHGRWMRLQEVCEAVAAQLTFDGEDLLPYAPGSTAPTWMHRARELLLSPPRDERIEWNRRGSYRRR